MNLYIRLISFSLLLVLLSCEGNAPTEIEIREKVKGKFCSSTHSLEISDSTYRNTKYHKGLTTGNQFMEYCKGTYKLEFENDQWVIHFFKDSSPSRTTIYDCEKKVAIWDAKQGYLVGETNVVMEDLFDGSKITRQGCN